MAKIIGIRYKYVYIHNTYVCIDAYIYIYIYICICVHQVSLSGTDWKYKYRVKPENGVFNHVWVRLPVSPNLPRSGTYKLALQPVQPARQPYACYPKLTPGRPFVPCRGGELHVPSHV